MYKLFLIILLIGYFSVLSAQDSTKSLAFKENNPHRKSPYFYQPDLSYQIWKQFKLVQEANNGDPLAQHELGMRYLFGEGIPADTSQALIWIKKASDKGLTAAKYNYGILLINGWGTEWNPFTAFKLFLEAAQAGMPQAQYITGLFFTDNLTTKQDWNKAYYWLKKSADNNFEPASNILDEIKNRATVDLSDSTLADDFEVDEISENVNSTDAISNATGLVFIDFDTSIDSIQNIDDELLVDDLNKIYDASQDKESIFKDDSTLAELSGKLDELKKLADGGSPEALTILGKLSEKGIHLDKDLIEAAAFYIRAIRIDSPRSPFLLYELMNNHDLLSLIHNRISSGSPEAMFVLYGLKELGYYNAISSEQAINYLQRSVNANYIPAIVELGLKYYTESSTDKEKIEAAGIWNVGEQFGSTEASVRIIASIVFDGIDVNVNYEIIPSLNAAIEEGSVLAEVVLAYVFENGIGTEKDLARAVRLYRQAAYRGSQYAYEQLQRIYDSIRPADKTFKIEEL